MSVVVLGGGSTGEAFVAALRRLDESRPITLVERRLVGGECSYFACMPTKAMLRPVEALAAARQVPGAAEAVSAPADASRVLWHRDQVTEDWDDASHEAWLSERRVELVRGEARVARPGVVAVGERELPYEVLVVATGSEPAVPDLEGLGRVPYWTNREAVRADRIPRSVAVLGGGPVGCELAQFYARMGAAVTIVEPGERLLSHLDPEASKLLAEAFAGERIALRLGMRAARVEPGVRVTLDDGSVVEAERLLVATGRRPNVHGLGLESLGVTTSPRGIAVDERLRAAPGVWAIGDVTGVALLTHVGKYQARVAAADVAGQDARADYRAIPSVVFTDPQVASVGTPDAPDTVSSVWRVDATARTSTYERPKRPGFVKLVADAARGVLVGAVAVGPEAGEWLGQLTLAVRAEVPVEVLVDTIQPYPTFSEAVHFAARDLPLDDKE